MQETETMQEAKAKGTVFFFLFFTLTQIFTFQDRSGTDGFTSLMLYIKWATAFLPPAHKTYVSLANGHDHIFFSSYEIPAPVFLQREDGRAFENTWTVEAPMPTPTPKKAPVSRIYCNKNTRQIGEKQNQTISKIQGAWLWSKPSQKNKTKKTLGITKTPHRTGWGRGIHNTKKKPRPIRDRNPEATQDGKKTQHEKAFQIKQETKPPKTPDSRRSTEPEDWSSSLLDSTYWLDIKSDPSGVCWNKYLADRTYQGPHGRNW